MQRIILKQSDKKILSQYSENQKPNEACGILFGKNNQVLDIFLTENTDESPVNFTISNEQLIEGYKIAEQFENKLVTKIYSGLTWGIWTENEGLIDEPIKRKRSDRTSFIVDETGRKATTGYKIERAWRYISNMRFYPKTGRTHQIRVHAAHMGHPIVADQKYGGGENRTKGFLPEVTRELQQVLTILERHALHAMSLEFVHPETAKTVSFQAPLPEDFNDTIKLLNEKYG